MCLTGNVILVTFSTMLSVHVL